MRNKTKPDRIFTGLLLSVLGVLLWAMAYGLMRLFQDSENSYFIGFLLVVFGVSLVLSLLGLFRVIRAVRSKSR